MTVGSDSVFPHAPSEALYRLLVEGVRDYAIFLLDPAGNVASWNAGAERIKGYAAAAIIGKHFSVFYPTAAQSAGVPGRGLDAAWADGRLEDEGWRVRADGSLFWANVVITALRGPQGERVGFSKITRDLTERKRAEEELQAAKEAAEAALAQVRRLTGLLPICGYCKRIRDDKAYWHQVEAYITTHTDAQFSHGICPACYERVVQPELDKLKLPRPRYVAVLATFARCRSNSRRLTILWCRLGRRARACRSGGTGSGG